MTTDNPAKVARAYAEQACYQDENIPIAEAGFRAGWKAARAHLAAQEPTDAEKDAAMDALGCELRVVENGQTTCDLHGGYATSDDVCEVVEVALSAARAARRNEDQR